MKKKQSIAKIVLMSLVMLALAACAAPGGGDDNSSTSSGGGNEVKKGTYSVDLMSEAGVENAAAVVLTIKDENKNVVLSSVRVPLTDKKASVSVPVGECTIEKFLIVDEANTILKITPVKGTPKAAGLDESKLLPFTVTIEEGKETAGELASVIKEAGDSADEFGLSPFDMIIYDPEQPDTVAPFIRNITITPSELTYTQQEGDHDFPIADFFIEAEDIGRGIKNISLSLSNPRSIANPDAPINNGFSIIFDENSFRYNARSGKWESWFEFNEYFESGDWIISTIKITDKAGNFIEYFTSNFDLQSNYKYQINREGAIEESDLGVSAGKLTYTSAFSDITPPEITEITLHNSTVAASGGQVVLEVKFTDNSGSGFYGYGVELFSQNERENPGTGEKILQANSQTVSYESDTDTYSLKMTFNFNARHEAGEWKVDMLSLEDMMGNETRLRGSEWHDNFVIPFENVESSFLNPVITKFAQ